MVNVIDLTSEMLIPEWKIHSMERLARLDELERENTELREIFKQFTFDKEQKDLIIKGPESCKYKPHLHEGVVVRGCNNEFSFKIKDAEYAFNFSKND